MIEENPFIDAVILDFTDAQIPEFLSDPQGNGFRNLHTRFSAPSVGKSKSGSFKYAVPLHEAFPLSRYHLPTILHHPFTVILSDFGCPYGCRFCYLQRVEHKLRDLENLREELEHIRRLGIRELLFMDASFGSSRKHTMRVCDLLQSVSNDFSWVCDMRVDAVDEQLLTAMKTAGCHTIMLGVETPNIEVLRRHGKPCSNEQTFEAFRLAARLGIRTLAHFIIGLSGETEESTENLIDFAIELDPTFASFNDARPVWNTTFREEVVNSGWVMDDGVEIGRGRFYPVWESPDLPRGTVWRLRNKAVRSFYLRPSYLLRQLAGIRTFYQMKTLLRQGLDTISEIFFSLLRRG
ncbi:MAG: radical SAM protein [Deltaproteobacteria bacterium]|nr:radical SAM protein [Deltaproteobacteria bacterium]